MNIVTQLRDYIVREHLPGEDPENLPVDGDLIDSGVLDSFAILQLVAHIEKQFGVVVATEDIDPIYFGTVERLASLVSARM